MKRFLFKFQYENPSQKKNNALFGYNEKDAEIVIITAPSKEKAVEWGKKLASKYLQLLYNDELISFDDHMEIEEIGAGYSPNALKRFHQIEYGIYPNMDNMLIKKYGQDLEIWQRELKLPGAKIHKRNELTYFIYAGIILLIIIIICYIISKK